MIADVEKAIQEAERVRREYNPDNLSPFPYQNIQSKVGNLTIFFSDVGVDNVSGAIMYNKTDNTYVIVVNTQKTDTRQHFTIAHELGHYFLHKDILSSGNWIIDGENNLDGSGGMLFRKDGEVKTSVEIEANNFAATLIMPEDLVIDAWNKIKDIEECAKIFNVSRLAMTIRLERLGLIKE